MVKFDPKKHHRHSIRLKGYDYSKAGAYYITIVAWHREFLFGEIVNKEMKLNKVGKIVEWEWLELSKRLLYIELGAHVVMPNHFHGILFIHEPEGATRQSQHSQTQNLCRTLRPKAWTGRPYPVDQNLHLSARSWHNSNHVLQNEYGNSLNSKALLFGSVIITNTLSATRMICKIKQITSKPIRCCGMRMMRIQSI